ncbi:MAG: helicase-related protein [Candidatus Hodarchaeota archaeon]
MPHQKSIIQKRQYQEMILKKLHDNFQKKHHSIAEVDTGMGKRVLIFLLIKEILIDSKILLLLHSTTSFSETIHYFKEEYGGLMNDSEFQTISSRTPGWLRKKILESKEVRVVAATPQAFANAFNKIKIEERIRFDVVIINEIDKIVRRQGDSRLLIFPYNTLIPFFVETGAWIVGMTGTMRDSHVFYDPNKDKVSVRHELITLDTRIPDLHMIRMDTLLKQTDIRDYIKYTYIYKYPVKANQELKDILELIDQAIKDLRENIIVETLEERPTLLESIPQHQIALVSGMLEANQSQKYQGLLLIRKYCTAMQVRKFKKFLYRLKKIGITKKHISNLPKKNDKVNTTLDIIQNQPKDSKTVILCSYLDTAYFIEGELKKSGITPFVVTGEVRDKGRILNEFKSYLEKSVLVMTSVGERDIDIPHAKMLIVYDTINTVKTMYQRMKRTRGGFVLCLYYAGTFEEKKVDRVLKEISTRYPWSSIVEKSD